MLTVDAQVVWQALPPSVRLPVLSSAPRFAVPPIDWWRGEWQMFWRIQRRFWDLRYRKGSGMCDEFSAAAVSCAIISGRRALGSEDCRVAAWDCRVRIDPGTSLHGVSDGAHALVLAGYHLPDDIEPQWALWEPQADSWTGNATDLRALPAGVTITDVWL